MYSSRDREWDRQLFVILDHFLPFYSPNHPKTQNFEKMKKPPGDIIILHRCTINDNHMMYGSWDTKSSKQNFLSFWNIFALLPPNNPKNQNFEKKKHISGDIIILHMCNQNHDHMLYCSWDMVHNQKSFYIYILVNVQLKNKWRE